MAARADKVVKDDVEENAKVSITKTKKQKKDDLFIIFLSI